MDYREMVMYQFYPLGVTGAPTYNPWDHDNAWNGATPPDINRVGRIQDWIGHLVKLGVDAVYFSPVFQSDSHGYDTRDYYTIDSRLGSNEDFASVCRGLHAAGLAVILDGVFNHTGRGFWAFRDIIKNRKDSPYADWYHIDWAQDSPHHDGFAYKAWEGHYDLPVLNLRNPEVVAHLFGAIEKWSSLFSIDGLRLDVAYCLDHDFLRQLREFCDQLPSCFGNGKFLLIGETIHSRDYVLTENLLDSCTNYELYKGLYSSLNETNMFELEHSLTRQSGDGGLFTDRHFVTFIDNHDVSRIAGILRDKRLLPVAYALLFTMPGIPCLYYGSEWGVGGKKEEGDDVLRPQFDGPRWNGLTDRIAHLAQVRKAHSVLAGGTCRTLCVTNGQLVFERAHGAPSQDGEGYEKIIVAVNCTEDRCVLPVKPGTPGGYGIFDGLYGEVKDLLTGETCSFNGPLELEAFDVRIWAVL